MKKTELNLATADVKTLKKSDLTKDRMLDFILENHNDDFEWFDELCQEHSDIAKSNLPNVEECLKFDIEVLREAFCEKYKKFYPLSAKGKRAERKRPETFAEKMERIRNERKASKVISIAS